MGIFHVTSYFQTFFFLQHCFNSMHPQNYLLPARRFERSYTSPELSLPFSLNGYLPDEEDSSISDDFSQRNTLDSFTVGYLQFLNGNVLLIINIYLYRVQR